MAVVNPPPEIRIPEVFAKDPEVFNYFKSKDFIIYQLWLRSGGAEDQTDDKSLNPISPVGLEEQIEDLQNNIVQFPVEFSERLENLENQITPAPVVELVEDIIVVAPDDKYIQLEEDDVVFMTGTNSFQLLPQANAYKRITIKNEGVGTITITPDGSETSETTSLSPTQSVTLAPRGASFSWSTV